MNIPWEFNIKFKPGLNKIWIQLNGDGRSKKVAILWHLNFQQLQMKSLKSFTAAVKPVASSINVVVWDMGLCVARVVLTALITVKTRQIQMIRL